MSDPSVFAAGEAAYITGVSQDTQRDWRRRGFLPPSVGKHTRFTVRELCHLRLIRAVLEAGFSLTLAASEISVEFTDSLQAEVNACANPEYSSGMLAIIARRDTSYFRQVVWSYQEIEDAVGCTGTEYETVHVIRLSKIAEDLVARGILDHPGLKDR